MLKIDAENGVNFNKNNWASQIKEMLEHMGLAELWINQSIAKPSLDIIKLRILDQFNQNWKSNINHLESLARIVHSKLILNSNHT